MTNTQLTKDARGLVSEVVAYLKKDTRVTSVAPRMQTLLTKVSSQAKREKTAHVQTSVAMTELEKKKISSVLEEMVGHEMELVNEVNAQIIGGLHIQVGDWVVDTTLSGQLTDMARRLIIH